MRIAPGLTGWRRGSGPPLVLIHGVGLRADAWAPLAERLDGLEAIAIDMPGHGGSAPAMGEGLRAYADPIGEALRAIGPCALAGHSMGAMVALDLAARMPGAVTAVAALNAVFRRPPEAARAVRARAAALSGTAPGDPSETLRRWFPAAGPHAAACREMLLAADPLAYKRAYSVFAAEDGPAEAALRRIECPSLFVTGSEEPNSTPAMSRAMAALAPRGRARIIDGARHMMPMTHAAELAPQLRALAGA